MIILKEWYRIIKITNMGIYDNVELSPSIASHDGLLYLVSRGPSDDQGIYCSTFDGSNWAPLKRIDGFSTSGTPSIASHDGKLYMAWKGISGDQQIYYSAFDGHEWTGLNSIQGVFTSEGPSIASHDGLLYLVSRGPSDDQGIYCSTFDGSNWAPLKRIDGFSTSGTPSIASHDGKLYMAWDLYGSNYATFDGEGWTTGSAIDGQQRYGQGTSIANYGGKLYLACGDGMDQSIHYSTFDGSNWAPLKRIDGFSTSGTPSIASHAGKLYMAWKGISGDQQIYYSAFDGHEWMPLKGTEHVPFCVDSLLMQDYQNTGNGYEELKSYRVVIRFPNPVEVGADKLVVIPTDDVTVRIRGKVEYLVNGQRHKFEPDPIGQVTFSIKATKLTAAPLMIKLNSMPDNNLVLVYPDEQIHHRLSKISGNELIDVNHRLLPENTTIGHANAVADAVKNALETIKHNYTETDQILLGTTHIPVSMSNSLPSASNPDFIKRSTRPAQVRHWKFSLLEKVNGGYAKPINCYEELTIDQALEHFNQKDNHVCYPDDIAPQLKKTSTLSSLWDLWNIIVNGAMTVIHMVVSAVSDVIDTTVDVAKKVFNNVVVLIRYLENGVEKIISFVIDSAKRALDMVTMIFTHFGATVEGVIEWLSALFNWNDILNTHNAIKNKINSGLDLLKYKYNDIISNTPDLGNVGNLSEVVSRFSSTVADDSIGKKIQDHKKEISSIQSNQGQWVLSTAFENADGISINDHTYPQQSPISGDIMESLRGQFNDDRKNNCYRDKINDYFNPISKDPSNLSDLRLSGITRLLREFFDIIKSPIDTLMRDMKNFVGDIIDKIKEILNHRIEIPVITWLYETVITNQSQFTILDLISLVMAAPITITYKLLNNGQSPFARSINSVKKLTGLPNSINLTGGDDNIEWNANSTYITIGVASIVFPFFDALIDYRGEEEGSDVLRAVSLYTIIVILVLKQGLTNPFASNDFSSNCKSTQIEASFWCVESVEVVFEIFSAVYNVGKNRSLLAANSYRNFSIMGKIMSMIFGFANLVGIILWTINASDEGESYYGLECVQEILGGVIPKIVKILKLLRSKRSDLAVILVDGTAGYLSAIFYFILKFSLQRVVV